MITRRFVLATFAALCASGVARGDRVRTARWDSTIDTPALDAMSVDGIRWSLDSLRGKVVVLNFWATWCEPCLAEMPQLSVLAQRHQSNGQLVVLGINYREGMAAIQRFTARHSPGFPILRDPEGTIFKVWRGTILPTTVLVARDGRARHLIHAADWSAKPASTASGAELQKWVQPTLFKPTDDIVRKTAQQITDGASDEHAKAQRIYDWIVVNTYREPKVPGCGPGDIKAMLETGNLGGKCADINGLFVGLCRAAGLPARDAYGVRLAPSAFGYREIGANSEKLQGAQHCRSEVYIREHGWVAMDPADVDKVMRQESSEWIKDADHPMVAPVRKGLFGGWEGNWMAYNNAADLALPGAAGGSLPFFMYPQAENENGRYDSLDAAAFSYTIAAQELTL